MDARVEKECGRAPALLAPHLPDPGLSTYDDRYRPAYHVQSHRWLAVAICASTQQADDAQVCVHGKRQKREKER